MNRYDKLRVCLGRALSQLSQGERKEAHRAILDACDELNKIDSAPLFRELTTATNSSGEYEPLPATNYK